MGLNIGGNTITQTSSTLTINTGVGMDLLSTGGVRRPRQTQFTAYNAGAAAWVKLTDNVYTKLPFPNPIVNINTCYDAANSRFTAPVGGSYFFQASSYLNKVADYGNYFHPVFSVNGSVQNGVVNTAYPNLRLRSHGVSIADYLDGQITQVYQLAAGDYVEAYVFSGVRVAGLGNQYYPPYMRFTGFLLG